jgi:hypothetical protein
MTDLAGVVSIYRGSDGSATKALYEKLSSRGAIGDIALTLFRACKCSDPAKAYRRGRGYKTAAYERKDWSIGNLAQVLHAQDAAQLLDLKWGWALDDDLRDRGDPHHHIIYVELPAGQVSFHNDQRYAGPDFSGQWDGVRGVASDRICRFVASVLQ